MQLNSLTLNSNTSSTFSQSYLALYDHKLAVVNTQVFVFGKTIQNVFIQTPLHKINLMSLNLQPVYTINAPNFEQFMMFPFRSNIYFWGKTPQSKENKLYEFDGLKFTKMDQYGTCPKISGVYCYTKFSDKYLILFGCLNEIQYQNKWYLFEIQKKQWKQLKTGIQIAIAEKYDIKWINGRGYLLLAQSYDKRSKKYNKNKIYQIKIKNMKKLELQIKQISLSKEIKEVNIIFNRIFNLDDKGLFIMGGQQIQNQHQNQKSTGYQDLQNTKTQKVNQIQIKNYQNHPYNKTNLDFNNNKLIFYFNLQTYQWDKSFQVPIYGHHHEIFTFNQTLFTVGGIYENQLISQIQSYDFKHLFTNLNFPYEQTLCYNCQSAFTYQQKLIYQPIIQQDYQTFFPINKFQNKFMKKLSQSIITELHAIGIICDYLLDLKAFQIQINLYQTINQTPSARQLKQKIQQTSTDILVIRSSTNQSQKLDILEGIYNSQVESINSENSQKLSIDIFKMKAACFKLGIGLLYATSTSQNQIFISYTSYSQTEFPQSNLRSFSQIYYTLKWNQSQKMIECSSLNNRNIIFQNVKLYFGRPQHYQNAQTIINNQLKNHFIDIYMVGVTNLEKSIFVQLKDNKYFQDIRIKSLNQKNPTNSLRKYLKHFYLTQNLNFKLNLQNQRVQFFNIYEQFQEKLKNSQAKEINILEEGIIKKNQNQETHFSTNQDQIISWKKIQQIEACRLFQTKKQYNNTSANFQKLIFIYHNKKLMKTLSTKKLIVCGVIQLSQNVQIQLNSRDFTNKSDERKILRWLEQIEN